MVTPKSLRGTVFTNAFTKLKSLFPFFLCYNSINTTISKPNFGPNLTNNFSMQVWRFSMGVNAKHIILVPIFSVTFIKDNNKFTPESLGPCNEVYDSARFKNRIYSYTGHKRPMYGDFHPACLMYSCVRYMYLYVCLYVIKNCIEPFTTIIWVC